MKTVLYIALILQLQFVIIAQDKSSSKYDRDTLITAAKEIMKTTSYCALITLDKTGHSAARTMDPFPPEENMIVWFGTNQNSRKVKQIKNDSRVTLYYEAPNGVGYVVIKGNAYLVDDSELKKKYWKEEWKSFYTDQKSNFILIKVIPDRLEIMDYKHGIIGDPKTWDVPFVKFKLSELN